MKVEKITRGHLAGLELATEQAGDAADMTELLDCLQGLIAQAQAAPEAEPVTWPSPDEINQMAFEEGQPADNGDGYLFTAEEFDLFVQRLIDSAPAQPSAVPEGNLLLTTEQVARHTATAWECPPQSRVILVSSLERLARKNAAAPHPQQPDAVPDDWRRMVERLADELDALNCAFRDQIDDDMADPEDESEACDATDELLDEARAMLAAYRAQQGKDSDL